MSVVQDVTHLSMWSWPSLLGDELLQNIGNQDSTDCVNETGQNMNMGF